MKKTNPIKKIIIAVAVLFIIIVGISIYFIINNIINSSTIELLVAPQSSDITIDGKRYTNGTYAMKPGEHRISISKEGFESKEETFTTEKDETTKVYLYLLEVEGSDWYATHESDRMILGTIMSSYSERDIEELYNKNFSIISELPIRIDYYSNNYSQHIKYTISYKPAENNSVISLIVTDYTGGNYDTAINYLRARGINPDDYEIVYTDESSGGGSGHAF